MFLRRRSRMALLSGTQSQKKHGAVGTFRSPYPTIMRRASRAVQIYRSPEVCVCRIDSNGEASRIASEPLSRRIKRSRTLPTSTFRPFFPLLASFAPPPCNPPPNSSILVPAVRWSPSFFSALSFRHRLADPRSQRSSRVGFHIQTAKAP